MPELLPPKPIEDEKPNLQTPTEVSVKEVSKDEEALHPAGYLAITLSEEDRARLETWASQHLDNIEREMATDLTRFLEEQNQLSGTMIAPDYPYVGAFRTNYPMTKKKAREVVNRSKQAYLDSDPIWAIDVGGGEPELQPYAQRLEKSMDDLVRDKLEVVTQLAQAMFEAGLHGTGLLAPLWEYQEDDHRDVQSYQGFDGIHAETLQGLRDFEGRYPDWKDHKELREVHGQIAKGETVTREFTYVKPSVNRPGLEYIPAKDSRVYPSVNGMEGLRATPIYGYLRTYTRSQLRVLIKDGVIDEDQWERVVTTQAGAEPNAREEQETHEILHATVRFRLEGDARPVRYKIWQERKTHVILRIRAYPWWYADPDLIPLYVREEDPGFYKKGIAWDVKDDHLILTVLLNLYLNGVDMANSLRTKALEDSPGYYYLASRRWSPHLPIPYKKDPKEIEQFGMETAHLQSILESIALMERVADSSTGTSALQSGRESPHDPRAPATKSLLLLQQVEPNLKEYLRSLEPGMRQAGKWILWMYYQGISLGWVENFPGVPDLPHALLPQLAEKLTPRALLFEFDRASRVETNLAVVKMLSEAGFIEDIPVAIRIAISQMNSQWSRSVDQLKLKLPTPPAPVSPPGPGAPPVSASPNGSGQAMGGRRAELARMVADQGEPG